MSEKCYRCYPTRDLKKLSLALSHNNFLFHTRFKLETKFPTMIKYAVLIFSIAIFATVQAEGCTGQAKIGSQADLDAINVCQTYTGTISVDGSSVQALQMNGVQIINGDLVLKNNDNLSSFNAPALQSIKGQLEMSNQTHLSSFVVPKLQTAEGINIAVLPQLVDVSFLNTINGLRKLSVTDTRAVNIQNAYVTDLQQLTLNNNVNLTSIQFPSLFKVDGDVYITGNGLSCSAEVISYLTWLLIVNFTKLILSSGILYPTTPAS